MKYILNSLLLPIIVFSSVHANRQDLDSPKENIGFSDRVNQYIIDNKTNSRTDISEDEYNQMISAIPQNNRYTENTVIYAKKNEPFLISFNADDYKIPDTIPYFISISMNLYLTDEQKKYFSSILELRADNDNSAHFIFIPCKTTTKPFFFEFRYEYLTYENLTPPYSPDDPIVPPYYPNLPCVIIPNHNEKWKDIDLGPKKQHFNDFPDFKPPFYLKRHTLETIPFAIEIE